MRIALIIHPRSEGETRVEALRTEVERLRAEGHRVSPRLTFERGDAARLAASASRAGMELVIAAGGDGTINEVVNGIHRSERQPRLAVVPTGTANDFAAGLGLPLEVRDAIDVAVGGRARPVDVALANRRAFVNVSTGGFGADATKPTPSDAKRRLGPWAYLVGGVKKIVELKPMRARFRADGELLHEGKFMLFAVGNARQTGGGTFLTPRAEFGDGRLDVVIVPGMSRVDFLALLPDLRAGSHLQSRDVLYAQAARFDVEAESSLNVNVDGEPLSGRRFRYEVSARPIMVMCP
ncbi:MAG: diacylglycerol/lipid kinase family protein [Longimicrobiales bacterium]